MKSESMDQINVRVAPFHIFGLSVGSIIFGSHELFQKKTQSCSFDFFFVISDC